MAGATESERAAAFQEAQAAYEAWYAAFYRSLSTDEKRALAAVPDEVLYTVAATGLDSVDDAAMPATVRAVLARLLETVLPLKERADAVLKG